MSAAPPANPAKPRRLRTIVPAPVAMLRSDAGAPDGLDLLDDMERVLGLPEDDSLAIALWLALRRVFTWAGTPVEKRRRLQGRGMIFRDCAAVARQEVPELAAALRLLPALWTRPERVEPWKVADACDQVGRWAADAGLMPTAGMFVEAAAAAEPENALRAMDAGLMCQRLGGPEMMQRAEQWHQRAFGLARVAVEDRRLLSIRALLARGNCALAAGRDLLARSCYEKAARRARRCEAWLYFAVAHHNLLSLVVQTNGDFATGEAHAQTALENYPQGHARLPMLAHDYAVLLNRHRLYSSAFRLLENLAPMFEQPERRLLANSSLALAAAGSGRQAVFEKAVDAALPLCPLYPDVAPFALVRIAEAALILEQVERARLFGERALDLATARADTETAGAANEVVSACQRGVRPHDTSNIACPPSDRLLQEFIAVVLQEQPPAEPEVVEVTTEPSKAGNRSRPQPLAPLWPLWGGVDTLAGLAVLHETECVSELPTDESLSLMLWTVLRNVRAWAGTPLERRGELFSAAVAPDADHVLFFRAKMPDLREAFSIFAVLRQSPELVGGARLGDACTQVGTWAANRGKMRTALLFTEVAAEAEPDNALRAMDAGLMCQRLGGTELMHRAEQWHQRAFGLARIAKKGRKLLGIRALLAYGNLALEVGNYQRAVKCYEKAARRAWRYDRRPYYAVAHHNLLSLVVKTNGDFATGEAHAQTALENYPQGHARLPMLAHDYAVLLNRHRLYSSAFRLLENLAPMFEQPERRLLANSSLALAAAGSGRQAAYEKAVDAALPLCLLYPDVAPFALVRIAEAACLLQDYDRAAQYADAALEQGVARGDADLLTEASSVRNRVDRNEPVAREADVPAHSRVAQLQRMLRSRLERHSSKGQRA